MVLSIFSWIIDLMGNLWIYRTFIYYMYSVNQIFKFKSLQNMCEKWQWHKSGLRNLIGGGGSTFCLITMFLGPIHYINQNHFIYKVSVFWEFYCTNEYSREDSPSQPSPPPLTRLFLWPWPYWTNSINILNIDLVSIDWNYAYMPRRNLYEFSLFVQKVIFCS